MTDTQSTTAAARHGSTFEFPGRPRSAPGPFVAEAEQAARDTASGLLLRFDLLTIRQLSSPVRRLRAK
ncbi:hypothetical protein [Streptomyces soliscabiei]|uniref:hypothetical protein n=1 Tax=Streptomyces soliscabiei TaxID=588897 RepID=UPI0029A30681|nr:hypothetical protein [Streptomyces sp. NY05-11A]MDX2677446.1 hypothetical protein [Streptomyces sp. NY05-11A]